MTDETRVVVWFSCGAASAVAAKLAVEKYGTERVVLAYCDVLSTEHPDNARFMRDVERWVGLPVRVLRSEDYESVDDVFERTRYMAGIKGARCTVEMKKRPRFAFQRPDDVHVFGMTADEGRRIERFERNNPELSLAWLLRDGGVTKQQCYELLEAAAITLPVMYGLGFKNNNCIGCVKATSIAYWRKVREHFPETFARRARQSRELGVRLTRLRGVRIFIDEIPEDQPDEPVTEDVSCGPECGTPEEARAGSSAEEGGTTRPRRCRTWCRSRSSKTSSIECSRRSTCT